MSAVGGKLARHVILPSLPVRSEPDVYLVTRRRAKAPRLRSRKQWLSSTAVFFLAAGGTFGIISVTVPGQYRSVPSVPPAGTVSAPSELGLRVESTAGGLLVRWNHHSRLTASADGGVLRIQDGPYLRDLPLSAEQIADGSILYKQKTGDVVFVLKVRRESGALATESLRVLDGTKPMQADGLIPPSSTALDVSWKTPRMPSSPADSRPAKVSEDLEHAFWLGSVRAIGRKPVPEISSAGRPPILSAAQGRVETPEGLATFGDLPRQAPVFNNAERLAYVGPKPMREVKPDLRLIQNVLPASPVSIEVVVRIDETGRVTDAHIEGKPRGALTEAALNAARQWVFEPALQHGKRIACEHAILFEFRPPDR